MNEPIGFDSYNLCLTGEVLRTLAAAGGGLNEHTPCVLLKNEPILLESNQNHATISQNGVCTTLSASMGCGGGYIPMIVQEVRNGRKNNSG